MHILLSVLLGAQGAAASPATLPPGTAFGNPTIIRMAGGGNLRDWRLGARGSDTLYVRDRTEKWYQVTLSGPCPARRHADALSYTTDQLGNFDQFSQLRSLYFPSQVCAVKEIRRSTAPADAAVNRKSRR